MYVDLSTGFPKQKPCDQGCRNKVQIVQKIDTKGSHLRLKSMFSKFCWIADVM